MSIPAKPAHFHPHGAPHGVEITLDAYRDPDGGEWWPTRPQIIPRLQLVHTNGAENEGSITSAINWGNSGIYTRTHPHYQVDRDRAAKLVPTDRRGIGNATSGSVRGTHGNVSDWSIVIETADEGYPTANRPDAPGETVGFIGTQIETVATILAYESILHGIPLAYPTEWHGPGTACHTEPFEFPYWTIFPGKVCPGAERKRQMREIVIPRAIVIADAWANPSGAPMTPHFAKVDEGDSAMLIIDATSARWLPDMDAVNAAATVCGNDWRDPIIMLPIDCKARVFVGQLPHYRAGSTAGTVRCSGEMWAQVI